MLAQRKLKMHQTLGLKLSSQMVNVLLSRRLESNNLEANSCSKIAKTHTEQPVFVKMLEMK